MLKILVPTGYMVAPDHGRFSVMICSGMTPPAEAMAMPGMDHAMAAMHSDAPDPGKSKDHGKPEMPCAFAGLSAQVLGAVDVVLLAVALAAVALMALRFVPHGVLRPADHLRPPLRGPPLIS